MEHLNKIAKGAIRFLDSNKTEKANQRAGRAIGTLSPVLDMFDEVNNVSACSSVQKKPKTKKDIEVVVLELVKTVLLVKTNRGNTCNSHAPKTCFIPKTKKN